MLVFRDGRETVSGPGRLQDLAGLLPRLSNPEPPDPVLLLDALLRAGELECALADAGCGKAQARVENVTDALAQALLQPNSGVRCGAESLGGLDVPATLQVSPPEGLAYYALHPLNYADLAGELARGSTAVIGIRSIGTTLSAVVLAELHRRGIPARRTSVRPIGHPFDRRLELDPANAAWIAAERDSDFWIVDEGPGLSGSSFLAAGEALERAGVAREWIRFLCSVEPRPHALCARDAAARWSRFQVHPVAAPWRHPAEAAIDISGGKWRERTFRQAAEWPAVWTQFERLKFLSPDERRLYKFEGFGCFGAEVAGRAQCIAEAGFGAPPRPEGDGFFSYPIISGRPATPASVSEPVLERLAAYCAFRSSAFRREAAGQPELERMMTWNHFEEFGDELGEGQRALPVKRSVVVDGRMQPHEWIEGTWLLKTDAASHGNDHFFPGPTDIAWDLAGAIVEWELSAEATDYFLRRYRALSGDEARPRIAAYRLAYTLFRMGYCKMAAEAMRGGDEEERLQRAYWAYRRLAEHLSRQAAAA